MDSVEYMHERLLERFQFNLSVYIEKERKFINHAIWTSFQISAPCNVFERQFLAFKFSGGGNDNIYYLHATLFGIFHICILYCFWDKRAFDKYQRSVRGWAFSIQALSRSPVCSLLCRYSIILNIFSFLKRKAGGSILFTYIRRKTTREFSEGKF